MTQRFDHQLDIVKFLKVYRSYPCLWDKSDVNIKNKVQRNIAEEVLMKTFGFNDVKHLKMKIRSLRCTYNQEFVKVRTSMNTKSEPVDIYKPKLSWFPYADSFLRKNYEYNAKLETNSVLTLGENVSKSSQQECDPLPKANQLTEDINSISKRKKKFKNSKPPSQSLTRKYCKKTKMNNTFDVVEALKLACSQQLNENEFMIFGQHVASQLRELPLDEALQLQNDIQRLLTEARLRSLNNHSMHRPTVYSYGDGMDSSSIIEYEVKNEPLEDECYELC